MLELLKQKISAWIRKREQIAEARKVYKNSRGTSHKRMLREDLSALDEIISTKEGIINEREKECGKIKEQLSCKYKKLAFLHYFQSNYDSIDGVGEKYSKLIVQLIKRTPNENWKYLNKMGNTIVNKTRAIKGIGNKKFYSLRKWCQENIQDIKKLSKKYSGDQEVCQEDKGKIKRLKEQISDIKSQIQELRKLRKKLNISLEQLEKTTARDFILANVDPKKHPESAEKANQYLKGFYPEWGNPPEWYNEIQAVLKGKGKMKHRKSTSFDNEDLEEILRKVNHKKNAIH